MSDKTVVVGCPSCDQDITLGGEIRLGKQVMCPNCGVELEVIDTDPVELDWPYEDYEYDDDGHKDHKDQDED
jgi:alpha-aminoadipate carrier protein LysW